MQIVLRSILAVALLAAAWFLYATVGFNGAVESGTRSARGHDEQAADLPRIVVDVEYQLTSTEVDDQGRQTAVPIPDQSADSVWIYLDDVLQGTHAELRGKIRTTPKVHELTVVCATTIRCVRRWNGWRRGYRTPFVTERFEEIDFAAVDGLPLRLQLASSLIVTETGRSAARWHRHSPEPGSDATLHEPLTPFEFEVAFVRLESVVQRHHRKASHDDVESVLSWLRPLEEMASSASGFLTPNPTLPVPEVVIRHGDRASGHSRPNEVRLASQTFREWRSDQIGSVRKWLAEDLDWLVAREARGALFSTDPDDRRRVDLLELQYSRSLVEIDQRLESFERALRLAEESSR